MRLSPSTLPQSQRFDLRAALRAVDRFSTWLTASPQRTLLIAFALSMLFGGLYARHLGQDTNFDQRNYHFESAYEFLSGRMAVDAAPSGLVHSFFNPLPYVPFYEMARHWHARSVIFALGAWHGVNFALAFALAYQLSAAQNQRRRAVIAAFTAILAAAGAMTLSEVGSSSSDLLLSPLILLGVWLLVAAADLGRVTPALALAGLASACVGLAIGLKLTHSVYALALASASLIGWRSWAQRLASLGVCGVAGALGVAASGGFWFLILWRRFRSPAFPYYDGVFRSPEIDPASGLHGNSFFDRRFLPGSLTDALTLPFRWMAPGHSTSELTFRDLRFGLLFALLLVGAALYLWRRLRRRGPGDAQALTGGEARLLVFFLVAFAIWLAQFGIQRYIVALELLTGPCLLVALRFVAPERWMPIALGGLALVAAATVIPANWGHVRPQRDWYAVTLPPFLQTPAVVLTARKTSFVGPFLPTESVVIGFTSAAPTRRGGAGFVNRTFDAALARLPELPVVLLVTELLDAAARKQLGRLGFDFDPACEAIPNAVAFVAACPLRRGAVNSLAAPPLQEGETLNFGASGAGAAALLSGWNPDTTWGNIGPGVSPKLILRGDGRSGEDPIRMTFHLAGLGDLDASDEIALQVGPQIVAAWPVKSIASDLSACVPAGLLTASAATEIAFLYRRIGDDAPPHRLGALGLASLKAENGGCEPANPLP